MKGGDVKEGSVLSGNFSFAFSASTYTRFIVGSYRLESFASQMCSVLDSPLLSGGKRDVDGLCIINPMASGMISITFFTHTCILLLESL